MNDVSQIFLILAFFELKKLFLAYPIHPTFILKRFQTDSLKTFVFHSLSHGFFSFLICMTLTSADASLSFLVSCIDLFLNFSLSLFRSRSGIIANWKPLELSEFLSASRRDKVSHRLYWLAYGFDRLMISLGHLLIVYILCQQGVVWMM